MNFKPDMDGVDDAPDIEQDPPDNEILPAFVREDEDDANETGAEEGAAQDEAEEEGEGEEAQGEGGEEAEEGEAEPDGKVIEAADTDLVEITVNKKRQLVPLSKLKADAQKVLAADERFQAAAEKERELTQREQKVIQTRQALDQVVAGVKKDPLAIQYHLLAKDIGPEEAYRAVVKMATDFIGKEFEFHNLPEEEKLRRRSETALQAKEREIARLKEEKQQREAQAQQERLIKELTDKAAQAGITDMDSLREIAGLFDNHHAAGDPRSIEDCIKEYQEQLPERRKKLIESLSDDDLRALNLSRSTASEKPKIPAVRRRRQASTSQAKPEPNTVPKKQKYFRNFREAYEATHKQ